MSANSGSMQALIDDLGLLRDRMVPMFEVMCEEWVNRTEPGYPVIFDNVESGGYFGINLDPGYGLYVMVDDGQILAQLNVIAWRTDVRSAANREKFSSMPTGGVKPVSSAMSDNELRNLISELMAHWNVQPLVIRVTDS
ncbi:MAG: hypothetical protein EA415_05525 [Sphaerobacteraceae bacterium]|nr:MAG: hypothetical protein EA415_05525 [Sphaerobacteraceae bacterium]